MIDAGPGGVHHVAIAVRDLDLLEAFYTRVLGLPVLRRWPMAGPHRGAPVDRSVWLDLGSGAFLALERAADAKVAGQGAASADRALGYLMIALRITRASRPDWEARLAAVGVAVVARTAYTLYVADPEGNRVGLSHWPDPAQDPTSPTSPTAGTTG
jgi:glyoxylase I family protein